jgi:hypothetical protein
MSPPASARAVPDLGPLTVEGTRPGGTTAPVVLDPATFGCARLVAELGRAWVRHESMGAGRHASAKEWRASVVAFGRHVDAVCPAAATMSVAAISVEVLHGYEAALAARCPAYSDLPAKRASQLFALLRSVEFDHPGVLDRAVAARLGERTARPNNRQGLPVADFGDGERLRLIEAARSSALGTEERIRRGRTLVAYADGSDHASDGWGWPQVVAAAARRELTVSGLRAVLPRRWKALPDDLRGLLPVSTNGKPRVGELVTLAYRHVFPHPLDLIGHFVLLALDTGAAPESLKDLVEADCAFKNGVVRVRLVKHRAHTITCRAYGDDRDASTASGDEGDGRVAFAARRFRDTGSVVRSLIDVTAAARLAGGLNQLFVCGIVHPTWQGVRISPVPWGERPFGTWVTHTGLDKPTTRTRWRRVGGVVVEGTEQLPAVAPPYDLRRLRKSNRAHLATEHPAEFHIWGDNELETFQRHYTRSATVFQVRAGRLLATVADALAAEASGRRLNVVTASAVGRLADGDAELAGRLGVDPATARQLASGACDVDGGIAACTDPTTSPFVEHGRLCDVARLGMCLRCPNAVVTPRHTVALARFDADHLERLRLDLPPAEWAQRGLPSRLLLRQVLAELDQPPDCPT